MMIILGADHRGFSLKGQLESWLIAQGSTIVDLSSPVADPQDDFPDIAFAVSDRVIATPGSVGILLCGSGGGVVIAANKVNGIRAAVGMKPADVVHNRDHNNINVLAIASDFTSFDEAKVLVDAFLKTPFDSSVPRFQRRLAKIAAREA
jgi:ribose 5-phosphate isomerase B